MLKLYCICIHKDRLLLKTRPPLLVKGVFSFKNSGKFFGKMGGYTLVVPKTWYSTSYGDMNLVVSIFMNPLSAFWISFLSGI